MKKTVQRIAAAMTLFGISAATFAAGEVQLLSARSNLCTGCPGGLNVTANIEVKNIAYAKIVGIHYKNGSGTWANQNGSYFMTSSGGKEVWNISNWAVTKNAYATYKKTMPSGVEVWSFSLPTAATITPANVQFAFNYTWTGGSAWDNNFGRNYGIHSQMFIAPR